MKKLILLLTILTTGFSGISQVSFIPEFIDTNHSDRAVVDMNSDFLDDVVSVSTTTIQIFFQQPNGTFIERNITTTPADNTPSWSLAAGDYDGNGFTDLLYGGGNGVTFMRANEDGTAYTEDSFPQFVFSQRSNFVDINNDGNLDAFVCHDVEPNVYYINDGAGNFTYYQGGIGDFPTGGHYGSVWIDYDNDGDIDMFNAKCGGGPDRRTDQLHNNDGTGVFTEVGEEAGLADPMSTWSSAWNDYNNDGYVDVFVGNSVDPNMHKLAINNGDGTFTDISESSGINVMSATGIENCSYDFNNDGYADIASNGNILLNNGDLTFTLYENVLPSNNGSFGDLNNDGFIDSFTGSTIYYNDTTNNDNHWITINTIGVESNRNGIGARISVTSALGTQIREVRSGEGFRMMSTLNTHFGLGADTEISVITITWPSGTVDVIENVSVDETITVTEGSTILSLNDSLVNNLILFPNPTSTVINLSSLDTFTQPEYSVYDVQGRRVMNASLNTQSIDVSALANGAYILKVADAQSVKTQKFIKN